MTEIIQDRTITETIYKAADGTTFTNEQECLWYEWREQAQVLYQLLAKGERDRMIELYSTEELAQEQLSRLSSSRDDYYIQEVYVDIRSASDDIAARAERNKMIRRK